MKTAQVNGIGIEYELIGEGEPLLLVHGSNLATALVPLAAALNAEAPSVQLVRYHRRGMAGSGGREWPISVEQQAADALGLLDALGLPSAHVLGYSYGGVVATQVALAAPERVRSLALVEPILAEVPSGKEFMGTVEPMLALGPGADYAPALRAMYEHLGGEHWRELLATAGPDAFEMAVRDTEVFCRAEAPSLADWSLDAERAAAVRARVLSVVGTESGPFFKEGRQLLHQRFARVTDADIPGTTHLLQIQAPGLIAAAVAAFLDDAVR